MSLSAEDFARSFAEVAGGELDKAVRKIEHCLRQLDHDQFWSRPAEDMNSVANLLLHLAGNIRQWIIAGVGNVEDVRERQKEFDDRSELPKDEILRRLHDTVSEAKLAIAGVSSDELLRRRRVQGFDVSGLQATFDSVSHFRGHTQEIVHMTRCLLGDGYEFDFVPSKEQA